MAAADTVAALCRHSGRGAGTNAERRAALELRDELHRAGRAAELETFWSRPNGAAAAAWHALLALAGSLVAVSSPKLGGGMILAAILATVLDAQAGVSPGRRLGRERASQNVVSPPPARPQDGAPDAGRVRLVITANYDAGRMGLVHRAFFRAPVTSLQRLARGRLPGWQAWFVLDMAWLLLIALLRNGGDGGRAIGVAQLIPTVILVLALAVLAELAVSQFGPAAGDNASGVAVAIALARALDVAPPDRLEVELVLQGAGDGAMRGLHRYLRRHRRGRRADTIVLGIAAAGAGAPHWWHSDGTLVPLRFAGRLRQIAAATAGPPATALARAHRGRGTSPALPARASGFAALTVGCLDPNGGVPRSHLPADTTETVTRRSMDQLLAFSLALVDALDAELAAGERGTALPAAVRTPT